MPAQPEEFLNKLPYRTPDTDHVEDLLPLQQHHGTVAAGDLEDQSHTQQQHHGTVAAVDREDQFQTQQQHAVDTTGDLEDTLHSQQQHAGDATGDTEDKPRLVRLDEAEQNDQIHGAVASIVPDRAIAEQQQYQSREVDLFPEGDGSFIIPAHLFDNLDPCSMLELEHPLCENILHVVSYTEVTREELLSSESVNSIEATIAESDFGESNEMVNSRQTADDDAIHGSRKQKRHEENWAKNKRRNRARRGEEKESRGNEKLDYDRNKADTQHSKATVKAECFTDGSRRMATFDLEAILQLPCGQVS